MSYIISGQVLDAGGTPVNGAEVVLNDGASISAIVTEATVFTSFRICAKEEILPSVRLSLTSRWRLRVRASTISTAIKL